MSPHSSAAFLPLYPTCGPSAWWRSPVRAAQPFPLSAPRARRYYFARNAIWHGLRALRLKPNGSVLMPAYHHGVEVAAVRAAGFKVEFYRVDEGMRTDADDLLKRLSPRTRAVYLTQFFGVPQPIGAVRSAADAAGVPLIEDCAMSMFGEDRGRPFGSRGDLAIFCVYKALPVPDGGLLVVNRPEVPLPDEPVPPRTFSPLVQLVRLHCDRAAFRFGPAGQRIRMTGYSLGHAAIAALALPKTPVGTTQFDPGVADWGISPLSSMLLKRLDARAVASRRRHNFAELAEALGPVANLPIPSLPEGACPAYFPIRVRDKAHFRAKLEVRGIESVDFWSVGSEPPGVFPEVERLRREVVCLPVHQDLESRHLDRVIHAVKEAL